MDDLPQWMQDYIGDHWNSTAKSAWGSLDNYIDAFDSSTFLWLADHTGDVNAAMLPDSDFALAYAHWQATGYDRDDIRYAQLLTEADYFDTIDDAAEFYEVGTYG